MNEELMLLAMESILAALLFCMYKVHTLLEHAEEYHDPQLDSLLVRAAWTEAMQHHIERLRHARAEEMLHEKE